MSTCSSSSAASYGYGAMLPSVPRRQPATRSAGSQSIYGAAVSFQNSNFRHRPSSSGYSYALMSGAPSIQHTLIYNLSGRGALLPYSLLGTCPTIVSSQFNWGQGQIVSGNFGNGPNWSGHSYVLSGATPSIQQTHNYNWPGHGSVLPDNLLGTCSSIVSSQLNRVQQQIVSGNFPNGPNRWGHSYVTLSGAPSSIQQTQNYDWSGRGAVLPDSLPGTCLSIVSSQFNGGQGQIVPGNFVDVLGATPSTQQATWGHRSNEWRENLKNTPQNC